MNEEEGGKRRIMRQPTSQPFVVPIVILLLLLVTGGGVLAWRTATGQSQTTPETIDFDAPRVAPDTVAIVNGEPVSGRLVDFAVAAGGDADYTLENTIDLLLLRQAGERLGLKATTLEAIEWLDNLEASWEGPGLTPERRAEIDAILIAQNLPISGLSSDPLVIEKLGIPTVTILNMRKYIADEAGIDTWHNAGNAIVAFLDQERTNAIIIDCRTETCVVATPTGESTP